MINITLSLPTAPEYRFNYAHNVPSDRITFVEAGKVQRKNQANMGDDEKRAYLDGIKQFNQFSTSPMIGGTYGQIVAIHRFPHRMHSRDGYAGMQRFLTWHRIYLADLESFIRSYTSVKNFFIPYWDWVANPSIPQWMNYLPLVNVASTESNPPPGTYDPVQVWRNPGDPNSLPKPQDIVNLFDNHTYTPFTENLETLHNNVHGYVGGSMGDIRTSPADPLFWLHHANIDRLWTAWQNYHPNENPDLPAPEWMDPWSVTEDKWRTNLYSEYV